MKPKFMEDKTYSAFCLIGSMIGCVLLIILAVVFGGCEIERKIDPRCSEYCIKNKGLIKTKDRYAKSTQDCIEYCSYPYKIKWWWKK